MEKENYDPGTTGPPRKPPEQQGVVWQEAFAGVTREGNRVRCAGECAAGPYGTSPMLSSATLLNPEPAILQGVDDAYP
jgi:hypothetical protein